MTSENSHSIKDSPFGFSRHRRVLEDQTDPVASARAASRRQAREAEASRTARDRDEQWRVNTQAKVKRLSLVASATVAVAVIAIVVAAGVSATSARIAAELRDQTVPMLTALHDLNRGDAVTTADLTVQEVPVKFAPADYLTESDLAALSLDTSPSVLLFPVSANNPISRSALSGSVSANDLPKNLGQGHVGLTLQLDAASGMGALLCVGDEVDVLSPADDHTATAVASQVRIVALENQLSGRPEDGYELVTLELTPAEASLVAAVQAPRLVVHSSLDTQNAAAEQEG